MPDPLEATYEAAMADGTINGAIICATDAEGSFVYKKALGERVLPSGERVPQRVDDVVFLASATKLLTSIAVLQCVEEGLVALDGDLSSVAPELASLQVLTGFSDDGQTVLLEPAARPITLRMLLTHSSGIAYSFMNPLLAQWCEKFAPPETMEDQPVEVAFGHPLASQPGVQWVYGPGLDWAGRIVERLTGQTLGERMRQRIWAPLGIDSGAFFPVTSPDLRARMVDVNPSDPEGLGSIVFGAMGAGALNKRAGGHCGGHGGFMSAEDYVKVLRSLLANDGTLLKPATVQDMSSPALSPEAAADHRAKVASPLGTFLAVGVPQDSKFGYATAGFLVMEDHEGWYGKGTVSWGGGLTISWFVDRKNNLCGITAPQSAGPADPMKMEDLKNAFRRGIYRAREAATK